VRVCVSPVVVKDDKHFISAVCQEEV